MYAMLAAEQAAAVPLMHRFAGTEISGQLDSYLYQYEEIGGLFGIAIVVALWENAPRQRDCLAGRARW